VQGFVFNLSLFYCLQNVSYSTFLPTAHLEASSSSISVPEEEVVIGINYVFNPIFF